MAENTALETIKAYPADPPRCQAFTDDQYANETLWTRYSDFAESPYATDNVWKWFENVRFDAAVDAPETGAAPVEVRYYNLQGVELTSPAAGEIYIVSRRYADGSVRTAKERM